MSIKMKAVDKRNKPTKWGRNTVKKTKHQSSFTQNNASNKNYTTLLIVIGILLGISVYYICR